MKNILILSHRNISKAPRIIREIDVLSPSFNIFALSASNDSSNKKVIESSFYSMRTILDRVINRFRMLYSKKTNTLYNPKFSKLKRYLVQNNISIIIIHEPNYLPLVMKYQKKLNIQVIFNAHEYHPLEFEDNPEWVKTTGKHYTRLYNKYLAQLDLLVNVSEGIRLKCLEDFYVDSIVVPNASPYNKIKPTINTSAEIKLIHHGVLLPSRHIEKMIKIVQELGDKYTLDIMGVKSPWEQQYFDELVEMTSKTTNVRIIEPVSFSEIIPFINSYDIGLYYLEPNNFNHIHALPNKFFEFMQAKLAIAISPSVEMVNIASKYDVAIVASGFSVDSMVDALRNITREDVNKMKKNSENAAKAENAERYQALFLENVRTLTNNRNK